MNLNNHKITEILLVEDNLGDAKLTIEAFKESKVKNKIIVVQDGVEAMDYLLKRGKYENVATPDIILLDLNLPKKDGREVLEEIKANDSLKRIPVIILTTSKAEEDIFKSYNLHANCYVLKPFDFERFLSVVKSIEDFWLTVVELPTNN
ncbi:MAG: response regulator [Candidatus Melainabacteria bacterium]|nr:response regulator [Candidatus Melainabacteria bacterium]